MTISLLLASSTFILSRLAEATHVLENRVKVESSQLAERDEELESTNGEIKELTSMLSVCANCKNVRDDKGYWIQVEQYITGLTDVAISHSICPDCRDLLYPDFNSGAEPPQPES